MISTALLLAFAAAPEWSGTVTMPIEQARAVLEPTAAPAVGPFSAVLTGQRLKAEVRGEFLEVSATFQVSVLDDHRWSRVSLLKLGPSASVKETSAAGNGSAVTVHQGEVVFVSKQLGTHDLEVKLVIKSQGDETRVARLTKGQDARDGSMQVEAGGPEALQQPGTVFSVDGVWQVTWKAKVRLAPVAAPVRPPMEPAVISAHAQIVSTVEGRARMMMEYRLALDHEQRLSVTLPNEWSLTRLSLNETPQQLPETRTLVLAVQPPSNGEREAVVKITLERDFGVFHLSGRLGLTLPGLSWPTPLVETSVHLPDVFQYKRMGGSLEPASSLDWVPPWMPGRNLRYRQHLVANTNPTLELEYAVDLTHRYFHLREDEQPTQ